MYEYTGSLASLFANTILWRTCSNDPDKYARLKGIDTGTSDKIGLLPLIANSIL